MTVVITVAIGVLRTVLFLVVMQWIGGSPAFAVGVHEDKFPRIPEPMVFDLVRPLGSVGGDFEINSLFQQSMGSEGGKLDIAPEFELAVLDGFGIEYERILKDDATNAHKVAFQGLFGTPVDGHLVHGWQYFGKLDTHKKTFKSTALYLVGHRLNREWSMMHMMGVQQNDKSEGGKIEGVDGDTKGIDRDAKGVSGLYNFSLFHNTTSWLVSGLETNFSFQSSGIQEAMIMPQVHIHFAEQYTVQLGHGVERRSDGDFTPLITWRVIFSLKDFFGFF
ncbi:MAG: hypothetical protein CMH81_08060 [Nitrospiraceae bacterium]|nr:hypothetical protein [Nitrospiraceae bacterium]